MITKAKRGWQEFERHVAQLLGLGLTITSGNKFYDPGDAVTRDRDDPFPLYADAKFTEYASKNLRMLDLYDAQNRALEAGKRMIMPIRFWPRNAVGPEDYVVIRLDDFAELIDMIRAEH